MRSFEVYNIDVAQKLQNLIFYTETIKYPNDRIFSVQNLTVLVDLSTEALMLQKVCISID